MAQASRVIGAVLMAILLVTAPVAATTPVGSQGEETVQSETSVVNMGTEFSSPSDTVSLNGSDENETIGENTTTDSTTPCCGGTGPADRPIWKYDSNYDAEISYSEADDAYQDYLDDIVTWETYLNVSTAYDNNDIVWFPDPDSDGMTIREEEVWSDQGVAMGTHTTNTDDDQFSDFADPRPNTEDIPPTINVSFPSGIFDSYTTFEFDDESGIKEWEIVSTKDTGQETVWATKSYEIPKNEDNITAKAVDNNGNEREILLNITENDDVRWMSSELAVAGLAPSSTYTGGTVIGSISGTAALAGTTVGSAIVAAGVTIAQLFLGEDTDGTEESNTGSMSTSQTAETYPTPGTYEWISNDVRNAIANENLPLRLPSGFGEEAPDSAGQDLHRGHGWEYIQLTLPGITQDEIEDILRYPNKVNDLSDGAIVIGDNPNGPGEIAIHINEGMILTARNLIEDYDPQGVDEKVELYEQRWQHIKDQLGSDHLTKSEIKNVVENADEVWTDGQEYLFVLEVDGVVKYVRVVDASGHKDAPGNGLEVSTAFKPNDGWDYIRDRINYRDMYQIYSNS